MTFSEEESKIWEKQNLKEAEEKINRASMGYDNKEENEDFEFKFLDEEE